jgi:uncharacterized protein (DUF2267 family)
LDDLIQDLQAKAGLSPEQAQKAVAVVAEFLENKVSDEQLRSIAGQIPGLSQYSSKLPNDLGDKLGGMARGLMGRGNS